MDFDLIQERPGKKIISVNDTPAHRFLQAVFYGDLVLMKNILERRPDILSDQLGLKALFIACEQGDIETIDFLLVKILQVNIFQYNSSLYFDFLIKMCIIVVCVNTARALQ